jgi:hypothetical protein
MMAPHTAVGTVTFPWDLYAAGKQAMPHVTVATCVLKRHALGLRLNGPNICGPLDELKE